MTRLGSLLEKRLVGDLSDQAPLAIQNRVQEVTHTHTHNFCTTHRRQDLNHTCRDFTQKGESAGDFPPMRLSQMYTGMALEKKHTSFLNQLILCETCMYMYRYEGR